MYRQLLRFGLLFAFVGALLPTTPAANAATLGRVVFDDSSYTAPTQYYGYHGFTVYDSNGQPVIGTYDAWTAVVSGPNGPLTFSGKLNYYGQGVFGYYAANPGIDVLTVTTAVAAGEATRNYGTEPFVPDAAVGTPVRVEFDDVHRSEANPHYGYHGFTAYDAAGNPVRGSFLGWTATVAGVNGPLSFQGRLDSGGRGVFGYYATNAGTDVLTVIVDAASGEATRSYDPGNPLPPLELALVEPSDDLNDDPTETAIAVPSPGSGWFYGFDNAPDADANGVHDFFSKRGNNDFQWGWNNFSLPGTTQNFRLSSSAHLTEGTNRGDVGIAKVYNNVRAGQQFSIEAYTRINEVKRDSTDDLRMRLTIHMYPSGGGRPMECNDKSTRAEAWRVLRIYRCEVPVGYADKLVVNTRLNAAKKATSTQTAGSGLMLVDYFKFKHENACSGVSCSLTTAGELL